MTANNVILYLGQRYLPTLLMQQVMKLCEYIKVDRNDVIFTTCDAAFKGQGMLDYSSIKEFFFIKFKYL